LRTSTVSVNRDPNGPWPAGHGLAQLTVHRWRSQFMIR